MKTEPAPAADNKLTSDHYPAFVEALEILYIKNNISGRLKFLEAWPEAAAYIFGEEFAGYDRDGAPDRERRAVLEAEADDRRVALLALIATIEEKSVDNGILQIEYVEETIKGFGRGLSLCIYGRWLVDRFLPPSAEETEEAAAPKEPAEPVYVPPARNKPARPLIDEDRMDRIKPISVEPEHSPPPDEGGPEGGVQGGARKSGLRILGISDEDKKPDDSANQ